MIAPVTYTSLVPALPEMTLAAGAMLLLMIGV